MQLTLNRPESLNSFNREMALLLQDLLKRAESDDAVRCVVITGSGRGFCAGQDLNEAIDPSGPSIVQIVVQHYNPIISLIRNLSKPVVAVVNGVAAGAGANIALACDLVLAAEEASFTQAFSKIGLIPDSGGTFILPRLVGWQRASALMMTGEKVSAREALAMGMVYQVHPLSELSAKAGALAGHLAAMPTKAFAYTKQLLNLSQVHNLNDQLIAESIYQEKAAATFDHKEGVQAFLEKRIPAFKGN